MKYSVEMHALFLKSLLEAIPRGMFLRVKCNIFLPVMKTRIVLRDRHYEIGKGYE